MIVIDAAGVREALGWTALIERIRAVFAAGADVPLRTAHTVGVPGEADGTLLMMPAWQGGRFIVVKIVNVFPGNAARNMPAVAASVLVFDGTTGAVHAVIEGGELTARRTAAASALTARYLARQDARHLVVAGTGRIAGNLVAAHCAVRPYSKVSVWGRVPAKAQGLADRLQGAAATVVAVDDLEQAVRDADVVSCATLAQDPLVRGAWLRPGTHVDLVGGFTPAMREADDETMQRAAIIVVDTFAGALSEAGDLVQPLQSGLLKRADIAAELAQLCSGTHPGRTGADQITVFKSVGTALEDYAAATLAIETPPR